jgi:ABC-type nitrate/sulfonate/bicarbonate transport system ATPase subunit
LETKEEIDMKLTMEQVSFCYPEQTDWLLENVSFQVASGTAVSILGPSGCGKSTLFYLLGGLIAPKNGKMQLDGGPLSGRGKVGYMPQASSLFPWFTVKENILLGQKLGRGGQSFPVQDWLIRAGLTDTEQLLPHQLSGGMQQRVSFLRALASGQDLLCLDEPFASLDALTRTNMQVWLASLMDEKRTFLLITHQLEEALLLTDRILLFPKYLHGQPIEVLNPFPRKERFIARKTPGFWGLIQELEAMLHQQISV